MSKKATKRSTQIQGRERDDFNSGDWPYADLYQQIPRFPGKLTRVPHSAKLLPDTSEAIHPMEASATKAILRLSLAICCGLLLLFLIPLSIGFRSVGEVEPSVKSIDYALEFQKITLALKPLPNEKEELLSRLSGARLIELLRSKPLDTPWGETALHEASLRRDERITALLTEFADNKSTATRVRALRALATPFHLSQAKALETMVAKISTDPDPIVRSLSARLLAETSGKEALSILQKRILEEKNSFVTAVIQRNIEAIEQKLGKRTYRQTSRG